MHQGYAWPIASVSEGAVSLPCDLGRKLIGCVWVRASSQPVMYGMLIDSKVVSPRSFSSFSICEKAEMGADARRRVGAAELRSPRVKG